MEAILERCLKWEVKKNMDLNQLLLERDLEIRLLKKEALEPQARLSQATSGVTE